MIEIFLVLLLIAWLISPIILILMYRSVVNERQKYKRLVQKLLAQRRIAPQEVLQEDLKIPPFGPVTSAAPAVQPQAVPVPAAQELLQRELQKLRALHAEGVLTDAELAEQEAKLLAPKAAMPQPFAPSQTVPVAPVGKRPEAANVPSKPTYPTEQPKPMAPAAPKPRDSVLAAHSTAKAPISPVIYTPPVSTQPSSASVVLPKKKNTTSAISVMLGVGVVLVILAGLLFVRTSWDALPSFGKLLLLGAVSVLFFGVSAMAYKFWGLKRTSMAFFSLGATYLPISIWAAGYLSLLGSGLSGGTNPWLLSLSMGAFTVMSILAVKRYQQTGWAVASLIGVSATYLLLMDALLPSYAIWTLSVAAFALLLTFLSKPLAPRLPACIGKIFGAYALVFTLCASLPLLFRVDEGNHAWYGFAGFAAAAAFLAPVISGRMKQGSAVPMALLTVYGFARVMHPLLEHDGLGLGFVMYIALVCIAGSVLLMLLVAFDALPEDAVDGYRWMYRIIAGIAIVIMLCCAVAGVGYTWVSILAAAVLLSATLLHAWRIEDVWLRSYAALETLVLLFAVGHTAMDKVELIYLLVSVLCCGCGIFFLFCKRLRTVLSDYLFSVTMALCACNVIFDYQEPLRWSTIGGLVMLAISAAWYFFMALEHRRQTPAKYCFAVMMPIALALFCSAVSEILLPKLGDGNLLIWSVLSMGIGFALYYQTKRGFAGVRACLFGFLMVPPLIVGLFAYTIYPVTVWPFGIALFDALAAVMLYRIFSNHGFRKLAVTSFVGALCLAMEAFYYCTYHVLEAAESYSRSISTCGAMMTVSVILLLLGIGAYIVIRQKLHFVGDYALTGTAQCALGVAVVWYGLYALIDNGQAICRILPALAAAAMALILYGIFAMRGHCKLTSVSFLSLALMLYTACYQCADAYWFREMRYGVRAEASLLVAGIVLLAVALFAYIIVRQKRNFRGDYGVVAAAEYALPFGVLLYGLFSITRSQGTIWQIGLSLLTAVISLILYGIYAIHEHRKLTVAGFLAGVLMEYTACYQFAYHFLFRESAYAARYCASLIVSGIILLAVTGFAFVMIRKRLSFRGDYAVVTAAEWGIPFAVVAYGLISLAVSSLTAWAILLILMTAVIALMLYGIYALRAKRIGAVVGFSAMVLLVYSAGYHGAHDFLFAQSSSSAQICASLMTAGMVLLLLAGFAYVIRRGMVAYTGDYAVTRTAAWVLPAAALVFGGVMMALSTDDWEMVYFFFSLALCGAAWFVSDPQRYVGSSVTMLSLICSLEVLRQQCPWTNHIAVAVLIVLYAAMTALFSYLGWVLRSQGQPRGIVLTVTGGIVPLWLLFAATDRRYIAVQVAWIRFFAPLLLAAFVLHLCFYVTRTGQKKAMCTIAAGLCTFALLAQSMFDFSGTYLEGKYHLLPLIGFGVVLRYLYGKNVGGNLLFGIGVYAMARLAVQAWTQEQPLDLLTVLICALVMFIIAFYIKQKKWFLLGGVCLCGIAARLSPGLQWWVYLLIAGALLIVIAAVNELSKQRGESMKEKVGRFWEDWEW